VYWKSCEMCDTVPTSLDMPRVPTSMLPEAENDRSARAPFCGGNRRAQACHSNTSGPTNAPVPDKPIDISHLPVPVGRGPRSSDQNTTGRHFD